MKLTLTQRLSVVFALLLVVCSGTSAWLQVRSNRMHELEVVQGLSRDLAAHIARDTQLMDADGLKPDAVRTLFSQLMLVNPSVEVYLLDIDGRVVGNALRFVPMAKVCLSGVWKASPGEGGQAVSAALKAGYRHIDTAAGYGQSTLHLRSL